MAEVNTGIYEDKTVIIKDARPNREMFTLDTSGFVLLDHTSKVIYPSSQTNSFLGRGLLFSQKRFYGCGSR